MTRVAWLLPALFLAGAGCGVDETFVLVSIESAPLLAPVTEIELVARNQGDAVSRRFPVEEHPLPATLTLQPTGRTGEIEIEVTAYDQAGVVRGVGATRADLASDQTVEVAVRLEAADFAVNVAVEGAQRPTFRGSRNGRQLASDAGGGFVAVYIDDCVARGRCDVFARLFAADSSPRSAGELVVNLEGVENDAPAVAMSATGALVAWETPTEIRAVVLTADGERLSTEETRLSAPGAAGPRDPDVAALADGTYAVVWSQEAADGGREIRGRLVDSAGDPVVNPVSGDDADFPVSPPGAAANPKAAAGASGRELAVVWEDGAAVGARFFGQDGVPHPVEDAPLVEHGDGAVVGGPEPAFAGGGRVVVAWAARDPSDPALAGGAIAWQRFDPATSQAVAPASVVDAPLAMPAAPSVAAGPDATIGLAWENCGERGDGSGCAIWFQAIGQDDTPLGPPAIANTARPGDQTGPSIAPTPDGFALLWSDESEQPPDTSSAAVRARVMPIGL